VPEAAVAIRELVSESIRKVPLFERHEGKLRLPRRARVQAPRVRPSRPPRKRFTATKICCSPIQSAVYKAWVPCPPGWRVVREGGVCYSPKEFNQGAKPADTLAAARKVPGLFDPEWARPRGYKAPPFIPKWFRAPRIKPTDIGRYCAELTEQAETARAEQPWLCPKRLPLQFPIYKCAPDLKVSCILEGRPVPTGWVTSIGALPEGCNLRKGAWRLPAELLKDKPPPDLAGLPRTPKELLRRAPPAVIPQVPTTAPAPAPVVTGYQLWRALAWPNGLIALPVGQSPPPGYVAYP
jgi:hypothetical protein